MKMKYGLQRCSLIIALVLMIFVPLHTQAASKKATSIFASAKAVGKVIAKKKFRYGKSKYTNLKDSIKKKRLFCADYVTWALQENGDLATKYRIYGTRSGNLAGNGRKAILKKYKKIKVNRRVSRTKFKPGDIVCVNHISGKFGWHFMIFAKYNKHDKPMWYSGGSDATNGSNRRYSKYKLTTPRRLYYYEKANTAFILRRK